MRRQPDRVIEIGYKCSTCGVTGGVQIALFADTQVVQFPENRCAKCEGFPVMEMLPPKTINMSKLVRHSGIGYPMPVEEITA